jgi:hypothetical protein
MGSRFHGWPEQAYAVLLKLDGEPSRETRERMRRDREKQVRQPMIDMLNDLADVDPWYEDFAVWRYASTAYWWQNQCAIVRVARNIDIAFRFNLDGLQIKAAWWYADPQQIALFRAATAADESGRMLEDAVLSPRTGTRSPAMSSSAFRAATLPITPVPTCSSTARSSPPASSNPTPCVTSSRYTAVANGCALCSTGSPSTRSSRRRGPRS